MDAYTKAIEVFEAVAAKARAKPLKSGKTLGEMIDAIVERDAEIQLCLWAISLLDEKSKASQGKCPTKSLTSVYKPDKRTQDFIS